VDYLQVNVYLKSLRGKQLPLDGLGQPTDEGTATIALAQMLYSFVPKNEMEMAIIVGAYSDTMAVIDNGLLSSKSMGEVSVSFNATQSSASLDRWAKLLEGLGIDPPPTGDIELGIGVV
jgi:hypothetical protein